MNLFLGTKFRRRFLNAVLGAVLVFGVISIDRLVARGTQSVSINPTMTVFDVGQGDSILVQDKKVQILIDGGPDNKVLEKIGTAMPAGDLVIELVVLTHPHADHFNGLVEVFDRYAVGRVLMTDLQSNAAGFKKIKQIITEKKIPVDIAPGIGSEKVGDFEFEVLHAGTAANPTGTDNPGNSGGLNDTSIVGMLRYKNDRVLLTGDATSAVEKELVQHKTDLSADVLKVSHHGSKYSTSSEFIAAVKPKFAAISVGTNNRYGHPSWDTTKRIKDAGVQLFRTDQGGDIVCGFLENGMDCGQVLTSNP